MKKYSLVACFFSIFHINSQGLSNGDIVARTPVAFPAYADVRDISWYYERALVRMREGQIDYV